MTKLLDSDPVISLFSSLRGKSVAVFPNTGNAGDGFIMFATLAMLRRFDVEYELFGPDSIVSGKTVLFGGGGNLIEGRYRTMADTIQANVGRNRCILLPHTILGFEGLADLTRSGFEIYLRESISYLAMLENGADSDAVHLAHDMTFYLPGLAFSDLRSKGAGTLYCLREDDERFGEESHPENVDLSLSWNGRWWTNEALCKASTYSLASAIEQFERVVTDRLHIAILSTVMGKDVHLGANSYYKNEAVFEHSMKPYFSNVEFHRSRRALLDSV